MKKHLLYGFVAILLLLILAGWWHNTSLKAYLVQNLNKKYNSKFEILELDYDTGWLNPDSIGVSYWGRAINFETDKIVHIEKNKHTNFKWTDDYSEYLYRPIASGELYSFAEETNKKYGLTIKEIGVDFLESPFEIDTYEDYIHKGYVVFSGYIEDITEENLDSVYEFGKKFYEQGYGTAIRLKSGLTGYDLISLTPEKYEKGEEYPSIETFRHSLFGREQGKFKRRNQL